MSTNEIELAARNYRQHLDWHRAALRDYCNTLAFYDSVARNAILDDRAGAGSYVVDCQSSYSSIVIIWLREKLTPGVMLCLIHEAAVYEHASERAKRRLDELHDDYCSVAAASGHDLGKLSDNASTLRDGVTGAFSHLQGIFLESLVTPGADDGETAELVNVLFKQAAQTAEALAAESAARLLAEDRIAVLESEMAALRSAQNEPDKPLSVRQLAERLGIPKKTVWRHVNELRARPGFEPQQADNGNKTLIFTAQQQATIAEHIRLNRRQTRPAKIR